jgi:hypothetical protein
MPSAPTDDGLKNRRKRHFARSQTSDEPPAVLSDLESEPEPVLQDKPVPLTAVQLQYTTASDPDPRTHGPTSLNTPHILDDDPLAFQPLAPAPREHVPKHDPERENEVARLATRATNPLTPEQLAAAKVLMKKAQSDSAKAAAQTRVIQNASKMVDPDSTPVPLPYDYDLKLLSRKTDIAENQAHQYKINIDRQKRNVPLVDYNTGISVTLSKRQDVKPFSVVSYP